MLTKGQRFEYAGEVYRVAWVNRSRAYCVPLKTRRVRIGMRQFNVTGRGISLSPESILDEWQKEGRRP